MKYGVLTFGYNTFTVFEDMRHEKGYYDINLGDNAQSIAVRSLYKHIGIDDSDIVDINRDKLTSYAGEPIILVTNGVFFLSSFPFPPSVIPVFVGFHASEAVIRSQSAWLKLHEPIGCRDDGTTELMRKYGIKAYTTGCLTLTLPARTETPRQPKLLVVYGSQAGHLPAKVLHYVPSDLLRNAEFIYHRLPVTEFPPSAEVLRTAELYENALLRRYRQEATLILTPLHHVAAPCIAFGIPTIVCRQTDDIRFSTLRKFLPIYTPETFDQMKWDAKPIELSAFRDDLVKKTIENINFAIKRNFNGSQIGESITKSSDNSSRRLAQKCFEIAETEPSWKAENLIRKAKAISHLIKGDGLAWGDFCSLIMNGSPSAKHVAAIVSKDIGNVDLSIKFLEDALSIQWTQTSAFLLSNLYLLGNRYRSAHLLAKKIARLSPKLASAHELEGRCLMELGQFSSATASFRNAKALGSPNEKLDAWLCRAEFLSGDVVGASQHAFRLSSKAIESPADRRLKAALMFQFGTLDDRRYAMQLMSETASIRDFPLSCQSLSESQLSVSMPPRELGGLGIEVALLPFVHEAARQFDDIELICDERLHPSIRRVLKTVPLKSSASPNRLCIDIYELMSVLLNDNWSVKPTIAPDPDRVKMLRDKYQSRFGSRPLIGVAWWTANNYIGSFRRRRVEDVLIEDETIGAAYISLQAPLWKAVSDINASKFGQEIFCDEEINPVDDLDSHIAQIAAVDKVISIDCTTAHLAGALGQDVTVLLSSPRYWIWPENLETMCLYENMKFKMFEAS